MQIEVSASDIKSDKKADDRGRVTLGSEYAGKSVAVAVLEVKDEDDVRTDGGEDLFGGDLLRIRDRVVRSEEADLRDALGELNEHRQDVIHALEGESEAKEVSSGGD